MPTVDLLHMLRDVDWVQVRAVLLVVNALIAAGLELTGFNPLAPSSGSHTRKAVLTRPQAVETTQPYLVAMCERNNAEVV